MYRAGTGDCFLLRFRSGDTVVCRLMIDCGCILGGRKDFEPIVKDIEDITGGVIDILVVTHEHADHINGFDRCKDLFDKFTFKKVWFAWTEDEDEELANDLRENHSKLKMALAMATTQLTGLVKDKYYESLFANEFQNSLMVRSKEYFIQSLASLDSLNMAAAPAANGTVPGMTQRFKEYNIIKEGTAVEYLSPGDLLKGPELPELPGMRVFVLGPPKDTDLLDLTEEAGEHFEKRENPSDIGFAFAAALTKKGLTGSYLPFEPQFEDGEGLALANLKADYDKTADWRRIDYDWLYTAGSLSLRYEGSINNTSLALAFQFEESERVLLFPGDAEFGNWKSWHEGLNWTIEVKGQHKKVNAGYLLNNTVFYKIGHHCSQNGSASRLGVDLMTHEDLVAMAPLSFKKIQTGWLNTMPNDLLCASLIGKTKGHFYFSGDRGQLLPNIKTDRVTIKKAHEETLNAVNEKFDGKVYIECGVKG